MAVILKQANSDSNASGMDSSTIPKRKVRVIEPRKKYTPIAKQTNATLRVAAYARVSSESDEQELSFETQVDFYRQIISNNPKYSLVDVYADDGITGTSTKKRDGFMRLMDDCMSGKVDMIITKSITRFARNTLDAIYWLRKLKEKGINVYFELENLHSLEANEMLLTMLSSIAQESSNTKSLSVKWGWQRQFEKGKAYIGNLFGYKKINGEIKIIEKEAIWVRKIFAMYIAGASEVQIKRYLKEQGVKTRSGNDEFSTSVIHVMLQNEKYMGDCLLGKTYNNDFLDQTRRKNTGQQPMFYVENSHTAIVSKEIFLQAQVERSRRTAKPIIKDFEGRVSRSKNGIPSRKNSKGRYSSINALSNRIFCFNCGSFYRRAVWKKRNGEKQPVWRCSAKLDRGKDRCPNSITLKESKLFEELHIIIKSILHSKKQLKEELAEKVSEFVNPKDIVETKKKLENQIHEVDEKISKNISQGMVLVSRGVQDESQLEEHLQQCYAEKKQLTGELDEVNAKLDAIRKTRKEKTLKILDQLNTEESCLTQEELAIFIEEIVVYDKKIDVRTTLNTTHEIDISKVK